ncbi:MAG TPA: HEAT repeat domain-containing protein, partial [Gammaproteobacteria bacterium]|nr:HEAT repeat domain-containing protein [Gammaproteobacteria bacterium]
DNDRVRADAAHFLGQTRSERAKPLLQTLADDPDPVVREVAREALESLPT